jgi:dihydropteroate synthase
VARRAIEAGADLINDVSAGLHDPKMFATAAERGVPLILMHMRGNPQTMSSLTQYDGNETDEEGGGGVVAGVIREINDRCRQAHKAGVHRWVQMVDPGIGFAKNLEQNLELLKNLGRFRSETGNLPVVLGTSRKGFLGKITGAEVPADRDSGTVASCVASLCLDDTPDACTILRVHNVAACKQAVKVMDAIRSTSSPPTSTRSS